LNLQLFFFENGPIVDEGDGAAVGTESGAIVDEGDCAAVGSDDEPIVDEGYGAAVGTDVRIIDEGDGAAAGTDVGPIVNKGIGAAVGSDVGPIVGADDGAIKDKGDGISQRVTRGSSNSKYGFGFSYSNNSCAFDSVSAILVYAYHYMDKPEEFFTEGGFKVQQLIEQFDITSAAKLNSVKQRLLDHIYYDSQTQLFEFGQMVGIEWMMLEFLKQPQIDNVLYNTFFFMVQKKHLKCANCNDRRKFNNNIYLISLPMAGYTTVEDCLNAKLITYGKSFAELNQLYTPISEDCKKCKVSLMVCFETLSLPRLLMVESMDVNNRFKRIDTTLKFQETTLYTLFGVIYFNRTHFIARIKRKINNVECVCQYDGMVKEGVLAPQDNGFPLSVTLRQQIYNGHFLFYVKNI